jgi:hypothetical protein
VRSWPSDRKGIGLTLKRSSSPSTHFSLPSRHWRQKPCHVGCHLIILFPALAPSEEIGASFNGLIERISPLWRQFQWLDWRDLSPSSAPLSSLPPLPHPYGGKQPTTLVIRVIGFVEPFKLSCGCHLPTLPPKLKVVIFMEHNTLSKVQAYKPPPGDDVTNVFLGVTNLHFNFVGGQSLLEPKLKTWVTLP